METSRQPTDPTTTLMSSGRDNDVAPLMPTPTLRHHDRSRHDDDHRGQHHQSPGDTARDPASIHTTLT